MGRNCPEELDKATDTMSDNYVHDQLKDALQKMHDQGYAKGRRDAVKALSISLHAVYNIGILTEVEKQGFKITLETVDATLKLLEQNNEELGF
jgi:hypothetical protein